MACRQCPAMEGRRRVLGQANGPVEAKVFFLAEAPGRLGAERSGVPLSGDQSGRNFSRLLHEAGLSRADVFITNIVLCNPQDARGLNRPPSTQERANCEPFLKNQLEIVAAPIVVTLGVAALESVSRVAPHGLRLRDHVASPVIWNGRTLVALYHPGPQAMLHRPFPIQVADYRALGVLVRGRFPPTA